MPSRTSTPATARQRSPRWLGSASPAETASRRRSEPAPRRHLLVCKQRSVERRHAVKDRRPMTAHDLEHSLRRRPLRQQHGRRADGHRERHGVAHAIGKEQLRRGENGVVFADADDALAHQPCRRHQRGVDVLDALGFAGRAGRIHPECDFVGQRRRHERRRGSVRDHVGEIVDIATGKSGHARRRRH